MEGKNNVKKVLGAVLGSLLMAVFLSFMIVTWTIAWIIEGEAIPVGVFLFMLCIFGIPLICLIVSLASRIKEILGGEEDEASKY